MSRCLVVHPGALGDVLLAGPALSHLRSLGFHTSLAVSGRLVTLLDESGLVDETRDLEDLALHRLFVDSPDPRALEDFAGFDALVLWLGAGDSTLAGNLATLGRPAVVARAVPPPGAARHASRHLVETLAPLGPLPVGVPAVRLRVAEAHRAVAHEWLVARKIGPAEAVVFQVGAGSPAKTWPGFATLARRVRDAGLPLVALAGPADASAVESLLRARVLVEESLARDWPLPELAALLALARVIVGNDSGPTHLAAAVGCPTVAVFGPTDPAVWAPVGPHVRSIAGPAAVTPWPGVDRVDAALRALLAGPATGTARGPARVGVGDGWR